MKSALRNIPMALVVIRFCLAPTILLLAILQPAPTAFAACLVAAFLSDYFDGVIARRLGVATARLRRLDSIADTVFYVCAAIAIIVIAPHLLRPFWPAFAVLLLLEIARYVYDLRKFGKEASYHMWSSKLWGLFLFLGVFAALVFRAGGWPIALAIGWGIIADIEGLAISRVIRRWQPDIPTFWHARRLARAEN